MAEAAEDIVLSDIAENRMSVKSRGRKSHFRNRDYAKSPEIDAVQLTVTFLVLSGECEIRISTTQVSSPEAGEQMKRLIRFSALPRIWTKPQQHGGNFSVPGPREREKFGKYRNR